MNAGPVLLGQDEPSADLFTEAYTDTFQETFFEALKQKGIENYDRARALLLKCKEMDPENTVIDHELAVVMAQEKAYAAAEEYALAAVVRNPEQYWYLKTLMEILRAQYKSTDNIADFPGGLEAVRYNLGRWHLEQEEGGKALEYLENLPDTGRVLAMRQLALRLENPMKPDPETPATATVQTPATNGAAEVMGRLGEMEASAQWDDLLVAASEATVLYPLQPQGFYYKGKALLEKGSAAEAVAELEMAEMLLLESGPWATRIYTSLERAHLILGNAKKAAQYAAKRKTGL